MNSPKMIGTHSGCFHCDEALACAILLISEEFKNHTIIRSRNMETLDKCDIVVDVGAAYDHDNKRYDHHQKLARNGISVRTFQETMNSLNSSFPSKIRLSSAGLVYFHYGKQVITKLSGVVGDTLDLIYRKVYETFIEGVDAIDNGIPQYDSKPRFT